MAFRFSYKPYKRFGREDDAEIYITMLSPSETSLELGWLGGGNGYTVNICRDGKTVKSVDTDGNRAVVNGLAPDTDYTVSVRGGGELFE